MSMAPYVLRASLRVERPIAEVFAFFSRAENLGRITPPEMRFAILDMSPRLMGNGTLIDYSIRLHGVPMRWRTLISDWAPPHRFVDEQLKGPYARWVHTHRFREDGPGATIIEDEVCYQLPLGALGRLVHPIVRRQLDRIFAYRSERVRELLEPSGATGDA